MPPAARRPHAAGQGNLRSILCEFFCDTLNVLGNTFSLRVLISVYYEEPESLHDEDFYFFLLKLCGDYLVIHLSIYVTRFGLV